MSLEASGSAPHIMQMRERHREMIVANLGKRTDRGLKLLESLYDVPVVTGATVEQPTGLSAPNANALIQSLAQKGEGPGICLQGLQLVGEEGFEPSPDRIRI